MYNQIVFLLGIILSVGAIDFKDILDVQPELEKCLLTTQMIDSSGYIPSGIMQGNLLHMGNFDECLGIKYLNKKSETVKGQYCLVRVGISPGLLNTSSPFGFSVMGFREPESTSNDVQNRIMLQNMNPADKSTGIVLGWCLPSTCPIFEMTSAINTLFQAANLSDDLHIDPLTGGMCQTADSIKNDYNTSNIIFISFLASTFFLMIVSTLYDTYLHYSKKKPAHIILIAFSVKSNGKKLLSVSNASDQLGCLHGIRVLTMLWVILGHTFMASAMGPIHNLSDLSPLIKGWENMYLHNAPLAVDTFFLMGGLLTAYMYCLSMDKGVKFNIILYYVHRYLRLTPVLAVIIWFHATIFGFFGSGPFAPMATDMFKAPCEKNWWAALLYIQNYYNPDEICVPPSWYLSIDMQLFIISPIILFPLWKWPKITMITSTLLVFGSMASSFAVTYVGDLNAFISDMTGDGQKYMRDYYYVSHTRYGPWLMGTMLGYYLYKLKKNKRHNKPKMHPVEVTFGWIVSIGLLLTTIYAGYDLFQDRNKLGDSFYNGFNRHGWALGVCWVIYACTQGYGGPVNTFLSWSLFQVLARFTYGVYLVHYQMQYIIQSSNIAETHFSYFNVIHDFLGDTVIAFAIGACLTLAYESPMITIEKVLFKKEGTKPKKVELPTNNRTLEEGRTNKGFRGD